MRRAVLAAALAAVTLAAGCDDSGKPELRDAIRLKAVPQAGHTLTSEDVDRSVKIMQRRLDKLGVKGKVRREGASVVVVESPAETRLPEWIYRRGLLEFYDLEAVLRGRSVAGGVVPHGMVLVSCRVATGACISTRPLSARKVFYLFKNSPAMTVRDLELSRTRADVDPNTGQPVVLIQFTPRGKRVFHELTRREAQRGAVACAGRRNQQAVLQCAQHFAIVLDHEIVSLPYIDFVLNPDGIPGDSGVELQLDSPREAKRIAIALQAGALPVPFVRLP